MALVLRKICDYYNYVFYEIKDERSASFFLIENPPIPFAMILLSYVLMVKYGPKFMDNRRPFDLKNVMMVYNFIQVILNTYIGVDAVFNVLLKDYNFQCEPCDYTTSRKGLFLLNLTYYYFLLKVLDLFDTLFIILRKKNAHLSFLHCYHHFFMCFGTYVAVRWVPGGHSTILGIVNAFVHGFMYFYYFFSALNPKLSRSVWKKRITQIQMLQFAFLLFHFLRGAFAPNCDYPKFWCWILIIQNVFMLSLFGDFYYKAYIKKKQKSH